MKKNSAANLIRHLLLSWLIAAVLELLLLPTGLRDLSILQGIGQMSLLRMIVVIAAVTILLTVLSRNQNTGKWERWGIVFAFLAIALLSLQTSSPRPFYGACMVIFAILVIYALAGWNADVIPVHVAKKAHKASVWITAGLAVAFFLFVSIWGVCRVYSFSTPTFDFGLFAQMFHSMKTIGLPMTTLERDGLLSHFAVHVSPIYYLMLPFYWLVPIPATLQVLQAAVLTSAVIPLWKLGKHHGFSGWGRFLLCLLLFVYPAYAGGTSYDLHENCFLTPLILWLLYGMDRKNTVLTAVAMVLTLMVKEDAAVYVAVAALWLIVRGILHPKNARWDLFAGISLLAVSLGWFFTVTGYLANKGDGVMTGRYNNFIYDGSGSLITVIKAAILCPMKVVFECVDAEKLKFLAWTLLPLMGLPLLTRRFERYLLLIPYILVNLMSDYTYQHDIFFQYTYGATAFLMYLTLVNLADWKYDRRRGIALLAAVLIGAACFGKHVYPKAKWYPEKLAKDYELFAEVREELDKIPVDAPVASATYYTTHLSGRHILYDIKYCSNPHLLSAEYVVLDPGISGDFKKYADEEGENGYENFSRILSRNGYVLQTKIGEKLEIYYKE